ncbi:MAG TPA: DNA polymerase III subunit delta [Bauldia sp.]|nr:DNA polymerase III subunit delta [Bauldia sp.]
MAQIKASDADRLLAKPDPRIRVVLIYGNDEGLVAERAEKFIAAVVGKDGEHLRFDPAWLSENPGRLADEANAIPMFGGTRAISLRVAGNRSVEGAVEAVLETPPQDSWIVVTAGELRKTSPIRKLAEASNAAWAIPCYADSERDLDRIIDEETRATKLAIDDDARSALKGLIGNDRMISRGEIQKLTLYASDKGNITLEDVRALVGDAGASATDDTIDAVATGDTAALDLGYRRLVADGTPGFVIAGAALRHFNFLQKARAAADDGESPDALVRRAVPPIYPFSRQPGVAKQIERWPAARIERALAMLDRAMIDSRLNGNLSDEVIAQTMHLVAALAPARRP